MYHLIAITVAAAAVAMFVSPMIANMVTVLNSVSATIAL